MTHAHMTGWIPPDQRTKEQNELDEQIKASMIPAFGSVGPAARPINNGDAYCLYRAFGKEQPPYVWQATGSCFPAGTMVRMGDGSEKPIEDVAVGDEVVTHTGGVRRVVETMRREYAGKMVTITPATFAFPLTMTADHRVATVGCSDWRVSERGKHLRWISAGELTAGDDVVIGRLPESKEPHPIIDMAEVLGDKCIVMDDLMSATGIDSGSGPTPLRRERAARYLLKHRDRKQWSGKVRLVSTRNKNCINRHIRVTPSLARLVGLYLAEGGVHEKRVTFTFNAKETHLADEVRSLVKGIFDSESEIIRQANRPTVLKVRVPNANVAAFFKWLVPGNVYSKRVPGIFMRSEEQVQTALLRGWMDGDGHVRIRHGAKSSAAMTGVTVCAELARDMRTLAAYCGLRAYVTKRRPRGRSREAYSVGFTGIEAARVFGLEQDGIATMKKARRNTDNKQCRFGTARRIKTIETTEVENLTVYDFEVEEDHSFVAGGIVVHNCVWAGGTSALRTLQKIEIVEKGEIEVFAPLFTLFAYEASRREGGMRRRGDGSFGSSFFNALVKHGVPRHDHSGLPQPSTRQGWVWYGSDTEFDWSYDPDKHEEWRDKAQEHRLFPVGGLTQVDSIEELDAALTDLRPCTIASMYGTKTIREKDGLMVARWNDEWAHQMFLDGVKKINGNKYYRCGNNWGPDAHPAPTDDSPAGGFWIPESDMAKNLDKRYTECFALSGLQGIQPRGDEIWNILSDIADRMDD